MKLENVLVQWSPLDWDSDNWGFRLIGTLSVEQTIVVQYINPSVKLQITVKGDIFIFAETTVHYTQYTLLSSKQKCVIHYQRRSGLSIEELSGQRFAPQGVKFIGGKLPPLQPVLLFFFLLFFCSFFPPRFPSDQTSEEKLAKK